MRGVDDLEKMRADTSACGAGLYFYVCQSLCLYACKGVYESLCLYVSLFIISVLVAMPNSCHGWLSATGVYCNVGVREFMD